VLDLFEIHPHYDLNIMGTNQGLSHITTTVLDGVAKVIGELQRDHLLVHGDTTTAFGAALAGFYAKVPVGHAEAGLRTGDIYAPFPEEMNRRLVDNIATSYFAPTETARAALLHEGKDDSAIHVTGNTVIDALLMMRERLTKSPRLTAKIASEFPFLHPGKNWSSSPAIAARISATGSGISVRRWPPSASAATSRSSTRCISIPMCKSQCGASSPTARTSASACRRIICPSSI
jgi:UDP-N-acetylglucosamine 2-epimerase